jgi:ubiquitin|tara:strand:- start:1089 stop:1430 length:342 start_codon:yes stop_codon:yes gene_type:complete
MKIKNEIENFIIYHCGSSEKDKTYLLNSLDQYIDNCHIIDDVSVMKPSLRKNIELKKALAEVDRLTSENIELKDNLLKFKDDLHDKKRAYKTLIHMYEIELIKNEELFKRYEK